jgi:hypothetical protein
VRKATYSSWHPLSLQCVVAHCASPTQVALTRTPSQAGYMPVVLLLTLAAGVEGQYDSRHSRHDALSPATGSTQSSKALDSFWHRGTGVGGNDDASETGATVGDSVAEADPFPPISGGSKSRDDWYGSSTPTSCWHDDGIDVHASRSSLGWQGVTHNRYAATAPKHDPHSHNSSSWQVALSSRPHTSDEDVDDAFKLGHDWTRHASHTLWATDADR